MSSLQEQLRKVQSGKQLQQQQRWRQEGEEAMARENASLKDTNTQLGEKLWRMEEKNRKLEEVGTNWKSAPFLGKSLS